MDRRPAPRSRNICAYTGRPYHSPDEMGIDLIERWNSRVGDADEVYVLGDLAMGHISETLPLAELLNGYKVLVPGNHDRCWDGLRRKRKDSVDRWRGEYEAAGFSIRPAPVAVTVAGRSVLADHFPYHGDSGHKERYLEYRPRDCGQWLLHGHVHQQWRQSDRMINVGVDAWGGYPVAEADLVDLILGGPAERAPIPWGALTSDGEGRLDPREQH